jgi:hypothetical protein
VQVTRLIALGKVKKVETVAKWLSKYAKRSRLSSFFNRLFYSKMGERELSIFCTTMLRQISDLLRPYERYPKE